MKCVFVVGAFLVACGGSKPGPSAEPLGNTAPLAPVVVSARAVGTVKELPPIVVFVEADRRPRLAIAASWDALAKGAFEKGPVKVHASVGESIYYTIYEGADLGKPRSHQHDVLRDAVDDDMLDLASLEDSCRQLLSADEDPPPPEEEDIPDDGGSGTAMTLEEGRMGRSQPARKPPSAARKVSGYRGDGPMPWNCADVPGIDPTLRRAQRIGEVDRDGQLEAAPALLVASPGLPASVLIDAIEKSRGGHDGVVYKGELRPLAIDFRSDRTVEWVDPERWLEVRVASSYIAVRMPGTPVPASATLATLGDTLAGVRQANRLNANVPVDVLVDRDVTAQQLVDVLAALIDAKQLVVGVGRAPKPAD